MYLRLYSFFRSLCRPNPQEQKAELVKTLVGDGLEANRYAVWFEQDAQGVYIVFLHF